MQLVGTLSAINVLLFLNVFVISVASERFSPMPGKCESAELRRGQERYCRQIEISIIARNILKKITELVKCLGAVNLVQHFEL